MLGDDPDSLPSERHRIRIRVRWHDCVVLASAARDGIMHFHAEFSGAITHLAVDFKFYVRLI